MSLDRRVSNTGEFKGNHSTVAISYVDDGMVIIIPVKV